MSKTKMRFWSGLTTIGGNIVEICYGDDRVIFDFGRAYNPADVLIATAQGRDGCRVADMLKLKMIPAMDGIYSKMDLEKVVGVRPTAYEDSKQNTAVFLSHLHLDHMGAIDVLAPALPVYMSADGAALYKELMKTGEGPFSQAIHAFNYEEPVSIGAINVTGYATDHDVFGSTAILVETPDICIGFSGDIRMHGQRPELNRHWIQAMKAKSLDYLLMEGTAFWAPRDDGSSDNKFIQISESEVAATIIDRIAGAEGVAFFNFYHRNLDRMMNLITAARATGRDIVFEPATGYLAATFYPDAKFKLLVQESPNSQEDWEKELYARYPAVTVAEINKTPKAYLVQNSFANIFSLMDYTAAGSIYIHTNGVPLGPFDPAFGSMQAFLGTLGIAFETVSSSGHGDVPAILDIINGISPKVLVPWHSTAPGEMIPLDKSQRVMIPELGRWY